jgi:DNA replication and repair protein RecF
MLLRLIELESFRSLRPARLDLDPGFNIFLGKNGQGKTNLLEGVYILASTKSFRTHQLADCVQHGTAEFMIAGKVERASLDRTLEIRWSAGGKKLKINGKETSILEYLGNLDVLSVSLDQLPVVRGGPSDRRRFLDRGIAQLKKIYLHKLAEFHRVLEQRNGLLARIRIRAAHPSDLEPWDPIYAEKCEAVSVERQCYVDRLNDALAEVEFSSDVLRLKYVRATPPGEFSAVLEKLANLRPLELEKGRSLAGPHRDDLRISLGSQDIRRFGSGGQQRSAVFSLLLAAMRLYHAENARDPVVIIDDVDAELDLERLQALLRMLQNGPQVFLSSAKANVLELMASAKRWELRLGEIQPL